MANRDPRDILFPARQYPPAALAAGKAALRQRGGNIRAANDAAEAAMQEAAAAAASTVPIAPPTPRPVARNDNVADRILASRFAGTPDGQQPGSTTERPLGNPATTPAAARILAARFGA